MRVLLIEDSPIAATMVDRHLQEGSSPSVAMTHAATLGEGLASLRLPQDVVLLDLTLPDGEGLTVVNTVHRSAPSVPIVVLTGTDDTRLAIQALDAGAQDYLVKHRLDGETLRRSIRYAIGRQQILDRLKHAVHEAHESEANLRQLLARSSDGILVISDTRRVLYANPAARVLLGVGTEGLNDATTPPIPLEPGIGEVEIVRDDVRVALDVRVVDVEWKGRRARMALLRDVSERRHAEDLRAQLERSERLASVGQLAAGVAHEINNPLTYLGANLELLARGLTRLRDANGIDVTSMLANVESARDGTQRVARIVREMSGFARTPEDEHTRNVDLRMVLESALSMAATEIRHRARTETSLERVPPVLAHEGRLVQVFVNLLVNAAHSVEEGRVARNAITVRTHPSASGQEAIVEIEDTGCGIAPEHLARVFEPFFTTKKLGAGSGLGLYICRGILASYGGAIEIESALGKGTLVRVRLPSSSVANTARQSELPPTITVSRRVHVLAVDDEPLVLASLVELLSPHHDVTTASSGEEAKRIIEARGAAAFDVLISDVVMHEGSGADLHAWIGKHAPVLGERMLFMGGGAVSPESTELQVTQRARWISKPFSSTELLTRIASLVQSVETQPVVE